MMEKGLAGRLCPTTQGLSELGRELLDDAVGLHVEDVVLQRGAGHQLKGSHVCTVHPDSVDLDTLSPGCSRHFFHLVLRSPVCHDDGHLGDIPRTRSGSRLLGESFIRCSFDGEAGHGASRQRLNAGDGFLQV